MINKRANLDELKKIIVNGQTIMVGGFLKCGYPDLLVRSLLVENEVSDLTMISNDTSTNDSSFFTLIDTGKASKILASYIGGNSATGKKYIDVPESVALYPQGSLAEKIRCGGSGLGGVLTKVGLGTVVEQGKQKIAVGADLYLLEEGVRADIALIYARKADKYGNLQMSGTEINFNSLMASAADTTIVLVDEIIDGFFGPEEITVPAMFVDYIVCEEK